MLFKNIIGQTTIKHKFIQSIQDGYIPHAQLLIGDHGRGSLALALGYARYLHCLNRQKEDSCGKCQSCYKFNKLIHPDLHFVFPCYNEKGATKIFCDDLLHLWRKFLLTNPYGGLSNWIKIIGIENHTQTLIYARESNEIIRKLNLKAYESEYKILIIWLPEKMHKATSNKLLKILEEPPSKTVFLLVSETPNIILETIRSRTHVIFIPPISNQALSSILTKTYNISQNNIKWILHSSKGDYEIAKQITSSINSEKYLKFFRTMMLNSYFKKYKEIKLTAEKFACLSRNTQKQKISYIQYMIRENFLFTFKEQKISYMTQKEYQFSVKFHSYINKDNILDLITVLSIAEDHLESDVNPVMIFFDLSIKIAQIFK